MVQYFVKELREQKPVLYYETKPTELQIACYLKQNSKVIKDELVNAIEPQQQDESNDETPTKEVKSIFK